MLNLIAWAVAGLIVGAIAWLFVPGRQAMGLIATMILGILGALVVGGISWLLFGPPGEPFSNHAWPGYLLSILGAFLVLVLAQSMSRRTV